MFWSQFPPKQRFAISPLLSCHPQEPHIVEKGLVFGTKDHSSKVIRSYQENEQAGEEMDDRRRSYQRCRSGSMEESCRGEKMETRTAGWCWRLCLTDHQKRWSSLELLLVEAFFSVSVCPSFRVPEAQWQQQVFEKEWNQMGQGVWKNAKAEKMKTGVYRFTGFSGFFRSEPVLAGFYSFSYWLGPGPEARPVPGLTGWTGRSGPGSKSLLLAVLILDSSVIRSHVK